MSEKRKQGKGLRSSSREYWKNIGARKHVLQLYSHDEELISSLNGFVRAGIYCGDPVLLVATPSHLRLLSKSLGDFGMDTDRLRIDRKLTFVDASGLLSCFMRNGVPDEQQFNETLAELLAGLPRAMGHVRVFGEMVALLAAENNLAASLLLEEMWNRTCSRRELTLFCAYPRHVFPHAEDGQCIHICAQHAGLLLPKSNCLEVNFRNF
jgi:hypothetical protein